MERYSEFRKSTRRVAKATPSVDAAADTAFEKLVEKELGLEGATPLKHGGKNWLVFPPRDLAGLALSGGGIRSATFNLGLLQGLNELGLLSSFDYLSTVSGGGYVGGFWTRWRSRRPGELETFPSRPGGNSQAESGEIRHLRQFSNFLSPRLGLLSFDTGRFVVAILGSTIPTLFASLSILLIAILGWLWLAWLLMGPPHGISVIGSPDISHTLFALVTIAVYTIFEVLWLKRGEKAAVIRYIWAAMLGVGVALAIWWMVLPRILPVEMLFTSAAYIPAKPPIQLQTWLYLLAPAGAWGLTALLLVQPRWIFSGVHKADAYLWPSELDRVASRTLLLAAGWIAIAAVWFAGAWLFGSNLSAKQATAYSGLTASLGAAFAAVQKLLAKYNRAPLGSRLIARLRPILPRILAYATVGLAAVGMALLILEADHDGLLLELTLGAFGVTLLMLLLFHPNRVGLHNFYRGRIARAFLGISDIRAESAPHSKQEFVPTDEQIGDDVKLDAPELSSITNPRHIICCAANDLAPADTLLNLHRGADSAVLSSVGFSVGPEWGKWSRKLQAPSFASAITASGAALNSHMGSKSIELGPAVTFLMSALNLRLGIWLQHPTRGTTRENWFPGAKFYRELFGFSRAKSPNVLLSDGGHFENMAVYELIRRHCRYIVASDCGMDTDVAFDDFGNLVRKTREDFGVEINIDLTPLRRGPSGLASQPMVAGDIIYPDGDTGVLLLFKPALTGDEPADIAQYSRRNSAFPHETTGDQFFDEAQWESYRRLGRYAAQSAFGRLAPEERDADSTSIRWVFARARRDWLAIRPGFEQRIEQVASGVGEIDALLHRDSPTLLRQVYKEIDELDRQAKERQKVTEMTQAAPVTEAPATEAPADPVATGSSEATPARSSATSPPLSMLNPKDIAPSLHTIRRALLVMEEFYVSENLELQANHPVYLGLINYFARWTYTPLFRMWWPLLKTMYSSKFTDFMETRFGLAAVGRGSDSEERVTVDLPPHETGFATSCWLLSNGRAAVPPEKVVSYEIAMDYRGENPYTVQAARVILRFSARSAIWDSADFYVPPGLWGVGIGTDFLRQLSRSRKALSAADHLVVRIGLGAEIQRSRKSLADETQLYRSQGFSEGTIEGSEIKCGAFVLSESAVRSGAPSPIGELYESRWLVRPIQRTRPVT